MEAFVVDTNFFISGFQSEPQKYSKFAQIVKKLKIKIVITSYIKGEMRHFLFRELEPHISVEKVDTEDFNQFLTRLYSLTTSVPQKPDLSVIYVAYKLKAKIVSSDIKLVETAELVNIQSYIDSAFIRYLIKKCDDSSSLRFLQELERKLFSAEIRYSVSSTNRYDPVKRISKIFDSAISVIKAEYEEKMSEIKEGDISEEEFSIQALQLKELIAEVWEDLSILETDFREEKYEELQPELISRVREIIDAIVDWRLASSDIEDHPIYNSSLVLLSRLLYLACICLIENRELELGRVFMDELLMIFFQSNAVVTDLDMEIHFLRIVLLLLTEQIHRLPSYFTPAFEDLCIRRNRPDLANLVHTLILLSVVLSNGKFEEKAVPRSYEDIEFINQIGFKFMQQGKTLQSRLMFEQSFHLALNSENYGLCILSLEFLTWLFFSGIPELKTTIEEYYDKLIRKSPKIKDSYKPVLKLKSSKSALKRFVSSSPKLLEEYPKEMSSPYYILSSETIKIKNIGFVPLIRTMNWDLTARVGIVDEKSSCIEKAVLGSIIYLVDGKYTIIEASSYVKKKFNVELLIFIDQTSDPTVVIKTPGGGWHLPKREETINIDEVEDDID
ncbi:MAG: hypothetical protein K9W46_13465 [Candidatus Heimdallarchaeum endolithica]|uniref:PIN domain-containing protein n=1 Tax=Candidatus Heimdallarchaeum endolithica TaxID=2876572 RepID=A0A9Y1BQG9_9ARCH|nr:MAG: hypothetical protein K9W46_13465 [Candidatus Heimdallarchaeum endolithica]